MDLTIRIKRYRITLPNRVGQDLQIPGSGSGTGGNRRFRNWNWSNRFRFQILKSGIWSDRFRFQILKSGIWYPPGTWYLRRRNLHYAASSSVLHSSIAIGLHLQSPSKIEFERICFSFTSSPSNASASLLHFISIERICFTSSVFDRQSASISCTAAPQVQLWKNKLQTVKVKLSNKRTQKLKTKEKQKFDTNLMLVTTNTGTSSMLKHLRSCNGHPNNIDNSQPKISMFKSSQSEGTTVSKWEFNQASTRQALTKMIVIDEQPFKQFFEATKRMSGTLYVTANMHYHEILGVLASLLEWRQDKDPTIVRMGDEMRKKFDKYYGSFGKTNVMVLVAVALDPRYKMRFVKFSLKKIFPLDDERVQYIYDEVYGVLKRLYEHYDNVSTEGKNVSHSKDDDGQNFVGIVKNKQMTKIYDEFYENDVDDVMEKSELEAYIESPPEKLNSESFEILKWWSDNCTTYKALSSMVKDILTVPVSTVASESAFNTSGRVVDDFRSSLGVKTVEALICTQDWLRASNVCIDLEQLLEDVEKYEKYIGDTIDEAIGQSSK
ncbi:hypothetical protein LXL04_037786 [Taraxacum kok-saghyz]